MKSFCKIKNADVKYLYDYKYGRKDGHCSIFYKMAD